MSKSRDENELEDINEAELEEDFLFEFENEPGVCLPPGFDMYESYGGIWYDPDDFRDTASDIEISLDHASDEEWQEFIKKIENK